MGSFDEYPQQIRIILERASNAGFRDMLLDEQAGNRFLYDTLASSSNDTLREIGEQLQNGLIDMEQLAASSCYREILQCGVREMSQFTPENMGIETEDKPADTPETRLRP